MAQFKISPEIVARIVTSVFPYPGLLVTYKLLSKSRAFEGPGASDVIIIL